MPSDLQDLIIRTWYGAKKERIKLISMFIPNTVEFRHTKPITAIIGLDSGGVATGSCDTTIKIWNGNTGVLQCTLVGHRAAITSLYSVGNYLVSASRDKTIRIWHVLRERPVAFRSVGAVVTRLGSLLF